MCNYRIDTNYLYYLIPKELDVDDLTYCQIVKYLIDLEDLEGYFEEAFIVDTFDYDNIDNMGIEGQLIDIMSEITERNLNTDLWGQSTTLDEFHQMCQKLFKKYGCNPETHNLYMSHSLHFTKVTSDIISKYQEDFSNHIFIINWSEYQDEIRKNPYYVVDVYDYEYYKHVDEKHESGKCDINLDDEDNIKTISVDTSHIKIPYHGGDEEFIAMCWGSKYENICSFRGIYHHVSICLNVLYDPDTQQEIDILVKTEAHA